MANPFRAASRITTGKRPTSYRASTWAGADFGRLYADWDAWTTSPDFETRFNFRALRARARSFARNNPWMVGFLDELANNVVGANGIMLQAVVKTALGKLAKNTNDEIEAGWEEWSHPENASADGHDSWIELQRLIIQTIAIDGECFVRRLRGFNNAFGYALQIIDADLVDESYNGVAENGNRIKMSVEVDRWNRPVAYWIWTRYAEDMDGTERRRERIAADDMLHLAPRWHRSNTTRGISWFAPVLVPARHLDGYEVSHIVASRAAASQSAALVNKNPDAIAAYKAPKKGEEPRFFEMEPGVMPELPPGYEIQMYNPNFPATNYGDFVVAVLRAIARGLKVSYLTLTGDMRQANYSSGRLSLEPERTHWRALQIWFATHGHRVVYRDWIDVAALKGAVALDARLGSDYYAVKWRGRGWKYIDPKTDVEALEKEIKIGINSRTRGAAEQGRDYEEVIDEIADEEEYAKGRDVDVSIPIAGAKPLPAEQPNSPDDAPPASGDNGDDSETTPGSSARRLAAVR